MWLEQDLKKNVSSKSSKIDLQLDEKVKKKLKPDRTKK